jgi:hypothetical protein
MLQDPKETIYHLRLVPEETLEALYPFKVENDYTARVAKYIWDYKNFVQRSNRILSASTVVGWIRINVLH